MPLANAQPQEETPAVDSADYCDEKGESEGEKREDCSHFLIAAIKSISGEIPENEFFAAHWKIRYGKKFFGMAGLDIALSSVGEDSVSSNSRQLTEAGVSVNLDLSNLIGFRHRDSLERGVYAGAGVKVFNAETYWAGGVGSIEYRNSPFEGSYLHLGYFRRIYPLKNDRMVIPDEPKLADDNLYAEFMIRSNTIDFFKLLIVRGGVVVPLLKSDGSFDDIQFRIAIAVPVGSLFRF